MLTFLSTFHQVSEIHQVLISVQDMNGRVHVRVQDSGAVMMTKICLA